MFLLHIYVHTLFYIILLTWHTHFLAQSGGTASGTGRGSSGNQVSDASLPEAREVRAGGKRFYFDVLQNDRGVFLKLSEVL